MKYSLPILASLFLSYACTFESSPTTSIQPIEDTSAVAIYYRQYTDSFPSISLGSVSNGALQHGKLMPFSGPNYQYFDTLSYLSGRAFMHHSVKATLLDTYAQLETITPNQTFFIMEAAHEHGGKLFPHRTHQNGLSIDFMVPLLKNGQPYYGLDTIGADHYWLDFNDHGQYTKDTSIMINFEVMAQHILMLNTMAHRNGLSIEKIILKMELKDELYATQHGQAIIDQGIYITKSLTPLINDLHDDHYHIDFKINSQ